MGKTMVFVSHSKEAVEFLCDRSIWINNGEVAMDGEADKVIETYLKECA